LVVWKGKLGVLEVDGPWHEGKAAEDHERDRLFRHHGIRVIERFDYERGYAMPDDVVAEFLRLLELNG
jgi:very-short-patch-repair endonuclease